MLVNFAFVISTACCSVRSPSGKVTLAKGSCSNNTLPTPCTVVHKNTLPTPCLHSLNSVMTAPSLHTGSLHLHLKAQFAVWQGLQIAGWTTPLIFFILSHHKSKDMTCLNYMLLGFLSVEGSSLPSMLSASSFLSEFSIHGFNCQQRLSRINMVPAMHCRGHCCVHNSTGWYCL